MSTQTDKVDARIKQETPAVMPHELAATRKAWTETNLMRRMLTMEMNYLIEEHKTELVTCKPEELLKIQGKIAGLEESLGKIKTQEAS